LERTQGPTVLALSRQRLPVLAPGGAVERGAYLVEKGTDIVLIGTGSEVSLCLASSELLSKEGVSAAVVSMPSWELFREQSQAYRDEVLPSGIPRIAVEAAASMGWREWVDATVTLDHFGTSAPGAVLFEKFGFTDEGVAAKARKLLR
jgi:transketolase